MSAPLLNLPQNVITRNMLYFSWLPLKYYNLMQIRLCIDRKVCKYWHLKLPVTPQNYGFGSWGLGASKVKFYWKCTVVAMAAWKCGDHEIRSTKELEGMFGNFNSFHLFNFTCPLMSFLSFWHANSNGSIQDYKYHGISMHIVINFDPFAHTDFIHPFINAFLPGIS